VLWLYVDSRRKAICIAISNVEAKNFLGIHFFLRALADASLRWVLDFLGLVLSGSTGCTKAA
jgi:hypothetical protein